MKRFSTLLLAVLALGSLAAAPPLASSVDEAFKPFWAATNPQEAAKAADGIVKSGVRFDEAFAALRRGRTYSGDVQKGVVKFKHHFALGDFWYSVEVPQDYNPARAYQLRVQLHGGVGGRENGDIRGTGSIGALAGVDQIYVMPASWNDAPWWSDSQVQNLRAVLDSVKRIYNVDENRINMAGVSDGATGTYYFAMRDTTPYSSFEALNGSLAVLQNPTIGRDGALFPNNLLNKPYFIVNGGLDPLYPTDSVEPYINHLKNKGVEVVYHPQPEGKHNTTWWPSEKDAFETFVRDHPRKPYPERLTWETDLGGDVTRAHWLVVNDVLNRPDPRDALPDVNIFGGSGPDDFGVLVDGMRIRSVVPSSTADRIGLYAGDIVTRINGQDPPKGQNFLGWLDTFEPGGPLVIAVTRDRRRVEIKADLDVDRIPPLPLFPNRKLTGRVDLQRAGNTISATTRGAAEMTLLISPDVFDFDKPIKVEADGRTVFEGKVQKSLETLLKWAARDNDRTMLFGAEIDIKLPAR